MKWYNHQMKRSLERLFLGIIFVALAIIGYNTYSDYRFKKEFDTRYLPTLWQKEREILANMRKNFGFSKKFPIIVTEKLPSRIYGLSTLDQSGRVVIYLNKKLFKESFDYILDDVLAHEYAHALLLASGQRSVVDGGHSKLWQLTCKKLGGVHCRRYVDREDVINRKLKKLF